MKNKLYLLTKLREYIFSGQITTGVYIDVNVVNEKPRYSPLGFILKELGVSDLDLVYLTESSPLTPSVNSLFEGNVNLPIEILNNIKKKLLFSGFTETELAELEAKNDGVIHEELYITIFNLIEDNLFDHTF